MADKLGLGSEVRQLKIGQSFTNPKGSSFHSIKYDFKPASVATNKISTVDVASNHQVTVTVPHLDGAGVPHTVFKGSQRPYQKECVLIIDRVTGEITLEKLGSNIQVKKTRSEPPAKAVQQLQQGGPGRSQTPPIAGQRISNRTKVTSGSRRGDRQITHLVPKHSPLGASPNYPSPRNRVSPSLPPPPQPPQQQEVASVLASLPMIGIDDFDLGPPPPPPPPAAAPPLKTSGEDVVGEISDSSSSSGSDSDDDSDLDPDKTTIPHNISNNNNGSGSGSSSKLGGYGRTNGHHHHHHHHNSGSHSNGTGLSPATGAINKVAAAHILNEDLCLSESGSDSD